MIPTDFARSDEVLPDGEAAGPDQPEVEEVPDARPPLSSLLFKTETERTPITEENAERLDRILEKAIGLPF